MTDRRLGTLIGQYRVESLLGQGGMAAVYQAEDTRSNRRVAIKLVHSHLASQKSVQEAFMQEAAHIARLSHPNIVRIVSFERVDDELVLVMELATGGNLRQYIKRMAESAEPIPLLHAVDIVVQLANAVQYAHQQGMSHRDLKPENVVLQPFTSAPGLFPFRPLITDFGLAQLNAADENAITDQPMGTYAYMSPEQALAEKIDSRTDIYSLGIILYELTVGQLPFKPQTIAEAARFHGREPVPAPSRILPDFPPRLEQVILKALEKDPDQRYQTAAEFSKALLSLRGSLTKASPLDRTNVIDASTEMRLVVSSGVVPAEAADEDYSTPPAEAAAEPPAAVEAPLVEAPAPTPEPPAATVEDALPPDEPPTLLDPLPDEPEQASADPTSVIRSESTTEPRRRPAGLFDAKTDSFRASELRRAIASAQGNRPLLGEDDALSRTTQRPPLSAPSVPADALSVDDRTPPPASTAGPLSVDDKTPPPNTDLEDLPLPTEWQEPAPRPAAPSGAGVPITVKPQLEGLITERQRQPLPPQPPRMLKISKNAPPATSGDYLIAMNVLRHTFAFPLDGDTFSIGTAEGQAIQLEAQQLSRQHALIQRTDEGFVVIDLNSTNGTWVNDQKLNPQQPTRWNYGDVFRMGDYWMTILQGEAAPDKPQFAPAEPRTRPPITVTVSKQSSGAAPVPVNAPRSPIPTGTSSANAGAVAVTPPPAPSPTAAPAAPRPAQPAARSDTPVRGTPAPKGFDAALDRTIISMEEVQSTMLDDASAPAAVTDKGLEGKTIHNYRLDKFLGQGGIASVYAATDLRLNRPVALKILHEALAAQEPFRKAFLEQARIATTLEHPNVVRVLAYDQNEEYVYMVMELITGGSLRQYLRKLRREDRVLPYTQIVEMGRQLAEGLHYAHQQGLLHRDIKPDNIVLRDQMAAILQPVLTDFGLAQVSANAIGETFITDQPTVTFPYMSPEAVVGARQDTRSDVYEIGVILYELTVGQVPFQPRSIGEAIRMHTREPVVRPSELRADVPRDLERVIMRCLEKDPNSRYQTAIELARTLEAISKSVEQKDQALFEPVIEDPNKTQVMNAPIDAQMPYFTPQPVTDDQIGYDRLLLYSEKYPTRAIRIERDILTIGRDANNTIVLECPTASRRHARIERFPGGFRLIDLGSRNGTYIALNRLLPNVAEVWEPSRTVRIGDYWLRLETNVQPPRVISRQQLMLTDLEGDTPATNGSYDQPMAAPAVAPLPPPLHDRIGLTVNNPVVTVQPGQTVSMSMQIHNLSNLVDHFVINVHGLPSSWYTIHAEPIYLLPNNRETASITLHPPLASTSSAGAHAFEISVTARAQGIKSVAQQCALNILPFYTFKIALQPQRVRSGGRTELEITNTGNTYDTYTVQARDRELAIRFQADGRQFSIPPGQTDYVAIRMAARSRPLIGVQNVLPFEVVANSLQPTVPAQTITGEVTVKPYFPAWIISFLMIGLVFCGFLFFLLYNAYTNTLSINNTATAAAIALTLSITPTPTPTLTLTPTPTPTLTPTFTLTPFPTIFGSMGDICPGSPPSRLRVGIVGKVEEGGVNNRLRDAPSTQDGAIIGLLPPGSTFQIIGGPTCDTTEFLRWWQVIAGGQTGWTAEGKGDEYYLVPADAPPSAFSGAIAVAGGTASPRVKGATDAVLASLPPADPAALDRQRVGFQLAEATNGARWPNALDLVNATGAGWVKVQVSWAELQPNGPNDISPAFQSLIANLQAARQSGLRVLVSIAKAPNWARAESYPRSGPPDDPAAFGRFVTLLLQQANGSINAVEIWNEPNLAYEWTGALPRTGAAYMRLFDAGYRAVRAISPEIVVVTAGLAPSIDGDLATDDRRFLRQMIAAGLANYRDIAIGVHPYGWANAPDVRCCVVIGERGWNDSPYFYFLDNLEITRTILTAGGINRPLWITEFGYPTWDGLPGQPPEEWYGYLSSEEQASFLVRAVQVAHNLGYVDNVFLWNLNFASDAELARSSAFNAFSLVLRDSDRRPAFQRLSGS
ncbi:MAG: protein kinase [Anaerolineae bacterium]